MEKYTPIHIGFDTSNYKTSLCAVDDLGNIISDRRILLQVKDKSRGMRQSEAVFNHMKNLPALMDLLIDDLNCKKGYKWKVESIAASDSPRPQADSYMPVFYVGTNFAKIYTSGLESGNTHPLFSVFSHQEGHIEAVKFYSDISDEENFIAFHFSGGTTETLLIDDYNHKKNIDIIGGSLDISFGQFIDRLGVAMGMKFPCGEEMDKMALQYLEETKKDKGKIKIGTGLLPPIKFVDGYFNLSGIETAALRQVGYADDNSLAFSAMYNIFQVIKKTILYFRDTLKINSYLFSGGVSSSGFLRKFLMDFAKTYDDINIVFGNPELCQDNSIGIALLSMKKYNSYKKI